LRPEILVGISSHYGNYCTVNAPVRALVVPIGVVTKTFLAEWVAVALMVKVAVTVVSFTTEMELTVIPVPETVIAVVPVSPAPLRVTETLVPCVPVAGAIEVNTGPVTVYATVPLVPPGVVTLMVLTPGAVVDVLARVASIVVELTTVTPLIDKPVVPEMVTVVPVIVKLDPVRTTGTLAPRRPVAGAIEVRVGAGGFTTVNVTVLVAPFGVVTKTFLAESVAVAVMVKVAVMVVSFTTERELTVTPVPEMVIAVAPVNPVPLRVTGTLVPRAPEAGAIAVNACPINV
jgi:hypothetical protein